MSATPELIRAYKLLDMACIAAAPATRQMTPEYEALSHLRQWLEDSNPVLRDNKESNSIIFEVLDMLERNDP